jgi:hypothetical protein
LKKYGEWVEFPKIGKKGRPKKPVIIHDKDLKYAQIVKSKQGGRLHKVERRVILVKI